MKRFAALGLVLSLATGGPSLAQDLSDWSAVESAAEGQTVYWNAWGGSQNINAYIDWVADEMAERHGITLEHVRVSDTAEAVSKVVAEKAAGREQGGTVDLIWINGENFIALKEAGLLLGGSWATKLPNWRYVDVTGKPTVATDFTEPTEGLESPWGMAQMVFWHDTARTDAEAMPHSAAAILDWAQDNPGRFAYPAPPDFVGSSFLKQVLVELAPDRAALQEPATDESFEAQAAPVFDYFDALTPLLWRSGRAYPENYPAMKNLLADGEVDLIFAFNPSEASSAIAAGELPDTVRPLAFPAGTIGNTHFVTIPFNAKATEAALVVANFLISPEAQLRKQDPDYWGDPTVLSLDALSADDRNAFADLDLGIATPSPDELGPVLDEPHVTWMERLEEEWQRRYAAGL